MLSTVSWGYQDGQRATSLSSAQTCGTGASMRTEPSEVRWAASMRECFAYSSCRVGSEGPV